MSKILKFVLIFFFSSIYIFFNASLTSFTVTPISGCTADDIKYNGSLTGFLTKDILVKKPGRIQVSLTVKNTASRSGTARIFLDIAPDLPPVAKFDTVTEVLRNFNDCCQATMSFICQSVSADGDTIMARIWEYAYDSNNDGDFSDETWITFSNANDTAPVLKVPEVGKYKVRETVAEGFGQASIPGFINEGDYKTAVYESVVEVGNIAPVMDLSFLKSAKADVYINVGNTTQNDINAINSKINTIMKPALAAKGVNANITVSGSLEGIDAVLPQCVWTPGSTRYFVNIGDTVLPELNDSAKLSGILENTLSNNIKYAGMGTSANQTQINSFVQQNSKNGTYINNTNLDAAINNLTGYVIGSFARKLDLYVNIGDTAQNGINAVNAEINAKLKPVLSSQNIDYNITVQNTGYKTVPFNKLYYGHGFGPDGRLYCYDPVTGAAAGVASFPYDNPDKVVVAPNGKVYCMANDSSGKYYLYEYDPVGGVNRKCNDDNILDFAVGLNNKVYYSVGGSGLYVYDPSQNYREYITSWGHSNFTSFITAYNGTVYFLDSGNSYKLYSVNTGNNSVAGYNLYVSSGDYDLGTDGKLYYRDFTYGDGAFYSFDFSTGTSTGVGGCRHFIRAPNGDFYFMGYYNDTWLYKYSISSHSTSFVMNTNLVGPMLSACAPDGNIYLTARCNMPGWETWTSEYRLDINTKAVTMINTPNFYGGTASYVNMDMTMQVKKEMHETLQSISTWRPDTTRYYAAIEDAVIPELNDAAKRNAALNSLSANGTCFIGIGTDVNQAQLDSFISQNGSRGAFISNSNLDSAFSTLSGYIIDRVEADIYINAGNTAQGNMGALNAGIDTILKPALASNNINANIILQSSASELGTVLSGTSWRLGAKHYFINIADGIMPELNDGGKSGDILYKLGSSQVDFVGMGTDANQAQINGLVTQNDNNGVYIDNTNMDAAFNNLVNHILDTRNTRPGVLQKYLLLDEEFRCSTFYSDAEADLQYASRWKFTHTDPDYFDNSLGTLANSGVYVPDPMTRFDKVGKIECVVQARDNPKDDMRFDNYRLWSNDSETRLLFYVHRKPIAQFNASFARTDGSGNYILNISESSYDPDHTSRIDKGITAKAWQWKELTAAAWNSGTPSVLAPNKSIIIQLQVRDLEGVWSDPAEQTVVTSNVNFDPTVDANPIERHWDNANADVTVTASDPDGDYDHTNYKWSASTDKPSSGWTAAASGSFPLTQPGEGVWYLHMEAFDSTGLSFYRMRGPYCIDKTLPSIDSNPASGSSDDPIHVTVNAEDSGGSFLNTVKYAWTQSTSEPASGAYTTITIPGDVNNYSFDTTLSSPGTWYLHMRAYDRAGNTFWRYRAYTVNTAPQIQSIDVRRTSHRYEEEHPEPDDTPIPEVWELAVPDKWDYNNVDEPDKLAGFICAGRNLGVKVVARGNITKVTFDFEHPRVLVNGEYQYYEDSIKTLDKYERWFEYYDPVQRDPRDPSPFCTVDRYVALNHMYEQYGLDEDTYSMDPPYPEKVSELDQDDANYYNPGAWPLDAVHCVYEHTRSEMAGKSFGGDYVNLDIRPAVDDPASNIVTFYYPIPFLAKQTLKTWHWIYRNEDVKWFDIDDGEILERITEPYKLTVRLYNGESYSETYIYFDILETWINFDYGYTSRIESKLLERNGHADCDEWETYIEP